MALSFNGTTAQYLSIADDAALTLGSDTPANNLWTLAGWCKRSAAGGTAAMRLHNWSSGNPSMLLNIKPSTDTPSYEFYFSFKDGDTGSIARSSDGTLGMTPGTWRHFAIARGADYLDFYVDGDLQSTNAMADTYGECNPAAALTIGYHATTPFAGDLAEFAKWDRDLQEDEIVSLANGASVLRYQDSIGWYLPMLNDARGWKKTGGLWAPLTVTDNSGGYSEGPVIERRELTTHCGLLAV